ncbi:MAG: PQQ-binding-like beta-propeller repeat protein [Pyrinomonadaceae bacterium]
MISIVISTSATVAAAGSHPQEPSIFSKCWEFAINSNLGIAPAADASAVYVLDDENKLHAIDLARGNNLWSSEVGGAVVSNLLVLDDSIFLVTSTQSDLPNSSGKTIVRALSRQTGITIWQTETALSPVVWLGPVMGNVASAGSDGSIAAYTRTDGKLVWKTDLTSPITSEPNFLDTSIELGTENHEVVRISGSTGGVQVAWKSEYRSTAVLTGTAGRLLVGDERGNLTLISADGVKAWRFKNGAQISSVMVHDSEYLAASHDNFVYKLSRSGNVKWKRRLSGRVLNKPVVLGDIAIVSIVGTGTVYALDLRNGKILNRIETGDEVSLRIAGASKGQEFIVAGPRALSNFSSKCPSK